MELSDSILPEIIIKKGHFVLSSGRHSDTYIEKFRILETPHLLMRMCYHMAQHFKGQDIDYIAGPSTGGMFVAYELARQMHTTAVYVEESNGQRVLKRNQTFLPNCKILVVDDVLTTGESLRETIKVMEKHGEIVGTAVMIDRSEVNIELPNFYSVFKTDFVSYPENEIPEWLSKIPISNL